MRRGRGGAGGSERGRSAGPAAERARSGGPASASGRGGGPAPRVRRGGFTLVELLVVVVIAGLLAGLAQPRLQRALLKARAAEAVSQLDVVEVAVRTYQAERHTWPPDRNRGVIPPGLDAYLPEGFTFAPGPFTIDYDNWSTKNPGFIGLTIITTDAELGAAMLELLGSGSTWTDGATKFTWVLEWS